MSAEWTAFDFKRQLAALVEAAVPSSTRVITYFPSPEEPITETVIVGHSINDDLEAVALGNKRFDEAVNLECQIRVARPGAGQTPADEAEDAAAALLAVLDSALRTDPPTVGNQTLRASVASRDAALFAFQASDGVPLRVCLVDFVVSYRARTSKS